MLACLIILFLCIQLELHVYTYSIICSSYVSVWLCCFTLHVILYISQNMDYVVVSGASRKNEKWEHSEGETVSVEGKSEAEKLATDPMYRLEHSVGDKRKAEDAAPRIAKIMVSLVQS